MIVIKVELRSARTGQVTTLGKAIICNDGTSKEPKYNNYDLFIGGKRDAIDDNDRAILARPNRKARLERFNNHSNVIWVMILKLLAKAYPETKI